MLTVGQLVLLYVSVVEKPLLSYSADCIKEVALVLEELLLFRVQLAQHQLWLLPNVRPFRQKGGVTERLNSLSLDMVFLGFIMVTWLTCRTIFIRRSTNA